MSEVNQEYHVDTDEILKELQAEGHEVAGQETPEPEAPSQQEPEVAETTKEPEVEPTTEPEEPKVDRTPKEPTLIPAWKAKIAEEKLTKENEILRQQLEALQANPSRENKEEVQDRIDNIRALAEEEGLVLDESQERFFNKLAGVLAQKVVPPDLQKNFEAFQQHQTITFLEQQYNDEFSKDVAPLIKERYGDISDKELATLRQKLHDTAFTETYAKVPLKKVFLAEMDDLGFKPSKQSIVTHKQGKTRNTDLDLSNVDESTFQSLNGDELDKFIEQKSQGSKWHRR